MVFRLSPDQTRAAMDILATRAQRMAVLLGQTNERLQVAMNCARTEEREDVVIALGALSENIADLYEMIGTIMADETKLLLEVTGGTTQQTH